MIRRWAMGSVALILMLSFRVSPAGAGFLEDLLEQASGKKSGPDETTVVAGLKEALDVGTRNAVREVGRKDGYFGNPAIRIPVPRELEKTEKLMRKVGFDRQVDEFIVSMNRAAEGAAPQAADIFMDAIRGMSIMDAYGIWRGDDTAATDYFREETSGDLYNLFKPAITDSMGKVGVVRSYKKMMKKYTSLPFVEEEPVDLEDYVTRRALDGLFAMIGEEEKKIRKDPVARVTDLLKAVFGGK